jgi:hypothetical protein
MTPLLAVIKRRPPDLTFDLNGDGQVNIADARKLTLLFNNPQGAPCP